MPLDDLSRLKILYAGQLGPGELCQIRYRALEELGPRLVPFDFDPYLRTHRRLAVRAIRKVEPRLFLRAINRGFLAAVEEARPDIVYVDKGVFFTEETMARAMEVRASSGLRPVFLHFHPDSAFHRLMFSALYKKTVKVYDCHFIPHKWVIPEHREHGARRVEYWPFGFYAPVHSPVPPGEPVAGDLAVDVAFVGRWERTRAADMERLVEEGVDVGVWGTIWERLSGESPLRSRIRWRSAIERELAAIATRSKISLGFLSEANLNGHTSRTFEIPASGGFYLAQRSDGQREFFEEDAEMACFGSREEMREKVHYYLRHDAEREKIRAAGLRRCLTSGYSYGDRFRALLAVAEECRAGLPVG